MKHKSEAEIMDANECSQSPNVSCSNNMTSPESFEPLEILKKDCRVSGEKMENITNGQTPIQAEDLKGDCRILVVDNVISSYSDRTEDEDLGSGCRTPTQNMFDPFAPGPEELAFAPKKNIVRATRIPIRRQLNFYFCNDDDDEDGEDDRLLDSISKSIIELVISSQKREFIDECVMAETISLESCKTPDSLPLLTGIADTCPSAPLRLASSRSRKLRDSICRKLDFEVTDF